MQVGEAGSLVGGAGSMLGGAGSLVGGVRIQTDKVMSQWVGGVTGGWCRIPHKYHCKTLVENIH